MRAPYFDIHTDAGLLMCYPRVVADFMEACYRKGFSTIMFMVMGAYKVWYNGVLLPIPDP
jgi:hypothetical protein